MNNVSQRLAEVRPAALDGDPAALDLAAITAQPQPGPRRAAPRRRLVLAATAFAAALAIAGINQLTHPTAGPAPEPGEVPHAAGPADARQLLLVAAERTALQGDGTDRYWHQTSQLGNRYDVGGYFVLGRTEMETWLPTFAGGTPVKCGTWLGAEPASDADLAAWQQAGSPTSWNSAPRNDPNVGRPIDSQPGARKCGGGPAMTYQLGGADLTPAQLEELPADPAALKELILTGEAAQRTAEGYQPADPARYQAEVLFSAATELLLRLPVSGQVRGAAYAMLADLPDITLVAQATDQLGRTGAGVEYTYRNADGPDHTHRLVVDLATGAMLAEEVREAGSTALRHYTVVSGTEFTAEAPPAS
ncbi:CU044_5270 family protein [Catellatospora sp. NPDC049609]|uniref:CU044_5270 family protein n=1 Tax=Catellatospora sp. NPDC049609 TaxID=3155505 RepID=UPI003414546E